MKQTWKQARKRVRLLAAFMAVLSVTALTAVTVAAEAADDSLGVKGSTEAALVKLSEEAGIPEAEEKPKQTKENRQEPDSIDTKEIQEEKETSMKAVKPEIPKTAEESAAEPSGQTDTGTKGAAETTTAPDAAAGTDSGAEASTRRVITCSEQDYNVLLRIVQAEAGNCDSRGRILVANVILNRVQSPEFPNTVTGVVYERSQFSPVSDGSINRCRVTKETIDAVDRALAGEDYSQGALYFMNRRSASGHNVRWFDTHLDYLFRHENHEFFR